MRMTKHWECGDWLFCEFADHGFQECKDKPLYGYILLADRTNTPSELFVSLEYAMAAAIAAKHTGKPSAGGTGVGSAADWFMKMIGAAA